MNNNNPTADDELKQKLIEEYVEIADTFYFEGSDKKEVVEEYAPEWADKMMAFINSQLTASYQSGLKRAVELIEDDDILTKDEADVHCKDTDTIILAYIKEARNGLRTRFRYALQAEIEKANQVVGKDGE